MLDETKQAIREMVCEQIKEANREGMIRYDVERKITFKQEMAYRLCHQDFFGLGTKEAAEIMEVTVQDIRQLLRCMRKVAPQLFPVLIPKLAKMYGMFMMGHTVSEIADCLNTTDRSVYRALKFLHDHKEQTGIYFRSDAGRRIVCYEPKFDAHIKEIW